MKFNRLVKIVQQPELKHDWLKVVKQKNISSTSMASTVSRRIYILYMHASDSTGSNELKWFYKHSKFHSEVTCRKLFCLV